MSKATCQNCDRTVLLVRVGGDLVVTDPELIVVVPAKERSAGAREDGTGAVCMQKSTTWARRVHADLCDVYKNQAARDKIQREQRAYNQKHGRPAPKRNHGL